MLAVVDVIPLAAFGAVGAVFGTVNTVVLPKNAAETLRTTKAAIVQMNPAQRDAFRLDVAALVWPLTLLTLLAAATTLGTFVFVFPILAGIDPSGSFDIVNALFVVMTGGWIALTWWAATRARQARRARKTIAGLIKVKDNRS